MIENALAVRDAIDLSPTLHSSIPQLKQKLAELREFMAEYMEKGEDYGIIPGTPKPTLLKPGAEKIAEAYGYAPVPVVTNRIEDWERGFFHYEIRCDLISKRTGVVVASGVGSCNSKEKRYQDRWMTAGKLKAAYPDLDTKGLKTREKESKFKAGEKYLEYLVANDDPYSLVNTILKMAKKRALVDAALSATRSSGIFTQDMEDIAEYEPEVSEGTKPPTPPPPPPITLPNWTRTVDGKKVPHQYAGKPLADIPTDGLLTILDGLKEKGKDTQYADLVTAMQREIDTRIAEADSVQGGG